MVPSEEDRGRVISEEAHNATGKDEISAGAAATEPETSRRTASGREMENLTERKGIVVCMKCVKNLRKSRRHRRPVTNRPQTLMTMKNDNKSSRFPAQY